MRTRPVPGAILCACSLAALAGTASARPAGRAAAGALAVFASASEARPAEATVARPTAAAAAGRLTAEQRRLLEQARYIYIASTRKDGSLSRPAEIWFMVADDAVWVASNPSSWRVKRIRWGRPRARIWIGSRDGPSFWARGEIVRDPSRYDAFCDRLEAKYPREWPRWERSFREGLPKGERVLIRYRPIASSR